MGLSYYLRSSLFLRLSSSLRSSLLLRSSSYFRAFSFFRLSSFLRPSSCFRLSSFLSLSSLLWHFSTKLKNPSWISGLLEPLPDASISTRSLEQRLEVHTHKHTGRIKKMQEFSFITRTVVTCEPHH